MTYIDFNKKPLIQTASDNTMQGAMVRAGGKHASVEIHLNTNGTNSINLFELTGTIEVLQLHGFITEVTYITSLNDVYIDLYDQTLSVPVTKTSGASMSGFNVGGFFIKDSDASVALNTINNNTCKMYEETSGNKAANPFIIVAKGNTSDKTYLRLTYTGGGTPAIDCKLSVHIEYRDIDSGTITPQ